jgi:hypothetical protein
VNVYNWRDTLSYQAGAVFDRVEDVELSDSSVMFGAHGAYFDDRRFYELLCRLVAESTPMG